MDSFRWILVLLGLLVVAGVYIYSLKSKPKKDLINNRPLIKPRVDSSILFEDPKSREEPIVDDFIDEPVYDSIDDIPVVDEPMLDEATLDDDEQLDLDDLDLSSLFNHASADTTPNQSPARDSHNNSGERQETHSPYLLNGSIIAFHIKPRQKQSLWGNDVLNTLNEYDIHYGDMKIFHCKVDGLNLFSILNMVEPGSFDINRLTAQQIPGLTAIMQLDQLDKKEQSFNTMIKKLGEMADVLDASIYDSKHEILTNQTLDVIRLAVTNYDA